MVICLNRSVLDFMERQLSPESFVLEFGAGGSTPWFAERCGRLVSIETSPEWKQRTEAAMHGDGWEIRLSGDPASAIDDIEGADLVLVDGHKSHRLAFAKAAWPKVKPGGWLILDDAQRHRPIVDWLGQFAHPKSLVWSVGDVISARPRIALAWEKN